MPKEISSTPVAIDHVRKVVAQTLENERELITAFHRLWYGVGFTWGMTYYEGRVVMKNPLDLWVQQELIQMNRPSLIIETGSAFGGSTLFYAHCLERSGSPGAEVISIDIDEAPPPVTHPRIRWIRGRSSTDPEVVEAITGEARGHGVMVILDSDHRRAHVEDELEAYGPLVTPGQFLVVEDTNVNGHPIDWLAGEGPHEAVEAWLPKHPEFRRDELAQRYLLTMHPGGWLQRTGAF